MEQIRSIALICGNGKVGRHIARTAAEKGYHVRMLTRQAANMASSDKLIEIREGDALDILLQNQHPDWSLVRLPFVKEGPCKGNIKVNLYDMPGSSITNSDIAAFLIRELEDPASIRQAPFISH